MMQGQSGFIFKYSTQNDEIPNSVIETADSGFIITAGIKTPTNGYQTLLIRLNKNGDSTFSKTLIFNNGISGLGSLIKLENGSYLGVGGKILGSGWFKLWLLNFTDNFTIIKDTSYFITTGSMFTYNGFVDHNSNLIIYGSLALTTTSAPHPFIFTSNQALDSLGYKFFDVSTSQVAYSMIEKPDSTGYIMMISGNYQVNLNSPSQLLTLDYSLNVNEIDSLPGKLGWYLNSKPINRHDIIVTGLRWYEGSIPQMEKIGIVKLDSTFTMKDVFYLGPQDTISYPGIYSNLDFIDTNRIFCAGTTNVNISNVYSAIPSFIIIGRFDSFLHLSWQKYFGGDQYYIVNCVRSVKDGGVIIGATSYDYQRQNHERDIFVIKVDSNGLITGQNELTPVKVDDVIVYPNPGNDFMDVETQLKGTAFHLYDFMGNEVYLKDLVPGRNRLAVMGLTEGVYFYTVVRDSQLIQSGKWIKY